MMRRMFVIAVSVCMFLVTLGTTASAATQLEPIKAVLNSQLQFKIDGNAWSPPVAPIIYDSTTYLPVRAVANALGVDIKYEASSSSIIIVSGKSEAKEKIAADPIARSNKLEPIKAQLNRKLKFQIDGEVWEPTAVPITYNSTTYLPVRALSGALGLDIKYDGANKMISVQTGGTSPNPKPVAKKMLFDTRYETGGYTMYSGTSSFLTFAGQKYSKVLHSPEPYVNMYVYPEGAYSTLRLNIASTEKAVVTFKDSKDKVLNSVIIPKGLVSPVELDVKGISGEQYVTVYVVPFYDNHDGGDVYIFDTSYYGNHALGGAVIPASPKTLPLFESQYSTGGYIEHHNESGQTEYNGVKYGRVLYSPAQYQNFYIYPKGEYKTFVLNLGVTEDAVVKFKNEKDVVLKTVNVVKGPVATIELDVAKFTGEQYVTVYIEPVDDELEGEIYILDTSYYK